MPTHGPINGGVAGGGGGGGGLPTLGSWSVVATELKLSGDANTALVPVTSGYIYDPKWEYQLMVSELATGTWGALGALATIRNFGAIGWLLPQGNTGEGGGALNDPANGLISFNTDGEQGGPWGFARISSGATFDVGADPVSFYGGITTSGDLLFGFRVTDGALCTLWGGNAGGNDNYFAAIGRQVIA